MSGFSFSGRPPRALAPVAAILLAGLAGPAARGQEENPELEFAQRLVERGWTVVAEPVIERSIKSSSPADKDRFILLRAQLLLQAAREASGARPRADAFKNAFASIEELIPEGKKPKTDGPQGGELGDFLISSASLIGEAARRETDAAQIAELKKYALRMLDTASVIFRARVEAAQAGAAASQGEEEEEGTASASRDEMSAAYNLARAGFERALLLQDKKEKQAALIEARKGFEDFQATYSETPLAFESAIFVGRIWTETDNHVKAMEAFEGATTLVRLFTDEAGRVLVDHPLAADIIQRALYLKAQAGNKCQKPAEAKEAVLRALRFFPRIQRTPIGWALRLEMAQSLLLQKKASEASRVAQEVEKEDRDGVWGQRAREFLASIIGNVAGDNAGAVKAIEELISQGKTNDAIKACRRVLSPLDLSEKQSADTAAPFCLLLGKAYSQAERHREAAIVYEELVERSPEYKDAPEAVFQAMKARLLANSKAPSALDEARLQTDRKKLTTSYPNSPQAAAAKYLEGDEALEAANYDAAKKLYLEVPETAGIYRDNALHQAGVTMWMLGYRGKNAQERKRGFEEAEKLFQNCLVVYGKVQPGLDPDRAQNRAKLVFATRVKLADIYSSPTVKKYQQALEQIEKAEQEATTTPEKAVAVSLKLSRARALAGLGKLDEAVQALAAVRADDPENRSLPFLCHDIGLAFDLRAQGKGAKAGKEYRDDLVKALEHYALWLDDSKRFKLRVSPTLATKTADRALAIALEVSELPEKKDSFTDALDRIVSGRKGSKPLPRTEWERAARLLEEARPKRNIGQTTDWLPLVKLGRAYGFLGEWAKARAALEEALVWGGFLASTGEAAPAPRFAAMEKAPDLLDIFIDLGFTELIPAKKGGLARAQGIFQKAFDQTQRESCSWWKCRYGFIAAEVKEGNYDRAQAQLNIVRQAFPQWDGDACGLKDRFEELKKELEAKLPAAPGK